MGLFDFFKKNKKADAPSSPGVIDTMSKADAITEAASKAAEQKAADEMDELTRLALEAGVETSDDDLDADGLIKKALNAIKSDDNATAINCFKKAMGMGSLEAKMNVARCYETGRGVSKDEPYAFKLYSQNVQAGHLGSANSLGNCYINGIGTPKDEAKGYETFLAAAKQGEEVAMANVAKCLMHGVGVERNPELGLEWFAKSAEAGNTNADFELGMTYLQVPEYRDKAQEGILRVRKAAENGIVEAMIVLAQIFDDGTPSKNMDESMKWWEMAAEKGDKHAQCRLGEILMYGRGGVQRDPQKGYHYLSFSAQQNYVPALYFLSELNLLFTNNNQDAMRNGLQTLTHCIKENYGPAFMLMGQLYLEGRAVQQDQAQAVKFFTLAANQGNLNAVLLLAKLYGGEIEGAQFDTDPAEAKHWYGVAAEKGHPVALHDLALLILKDEASTDDEKEQAADHLRKAAKAGYTQALQTMTEYGISAE